ncbi:MAG: hypothetical protein OES13_07900 [Acidimicrobiia bacterium]|nr:hypothetical protein [Acidimicrobiia bacterium]
MLPGTVRFLVATATVVIMVSVVAGIGAAAVGGSLSDLGSGYGGLWGLPALLLTFVALFLGVAAAIQIGRVLGPEVRRSRLAVLVLAGVWVVAIGYSEIAHLVDPCTNGWWDANSRIGSQPLCERFGSELNWHTRFHLFAHAVPAAILLVPYLWAILRWGTPTSAQTDREKTAEPSAVDGARDDWR